MLQSTLLERKQAVFPAFLSRILFNLNIGSRFGQSIHRSSCNLKWRLKSNPMHGLQYFVFRAASASCFNRRFKKLLEDKYQIFLNSTSEHLRDGALKHSGLYLQQFFNPVLKMSDILITLLTVHVLEPSSQQYLLTGIFQLKVSISSALTYHPFVINLLSISLFPLLTCCTKIHTGAPKHFSSSGSSISLSKLDAYALNVPLHLSWLPRERSLGRLATRRCFGQVPCRSEHPVPLSLGAALVLFLYILFG